MVVGKNPRQFVRKNRFGALTYNTGHPEAPKKSAALNLRCCATLPRAALPKIILRGSIGLLDLVRTAPLGGHR
jgi:hypothetical protein